MARPKKEKKSAQNSLEEYQLMSQRMVQADENFIHKPIQTEKTLYDLVTTGNIEGLKKRKPSLLKKGLGVLSSNEFRNILYHLIINTSNCARNCIDAGMDLDTAYTLSDLYIRKADHATTLEELERINYSMMFDYTARMCALFSQKSPYSELIQRAIDYMDAHIHKPIYAKDVAEYLHISTATFSKKFLEDTGLHFNTYLEEKRIYLAKRYLLQTHLPVADIATNLAFCSPSYFSTRFKRIVGYTPLQYRARHSEQPS